MTNQDATPDAGVYLLVIRLRSTVEKAGRGGCLVLPPGWYVYIGRAVPGLRARLARHIRGPAVKRWHVDALLQAGAVVDVQVRFTKDKTDECRTASEAGSWPGAEPVPGFGASDCRCPTHLYRFSERPFFALHTRRVIADLPEIYSRLREWYDNHAARDRDPFRTLVACILSLRTRDPVTHAAAERLFRKFRTPAEFANADPGRIAALIHPVGMFRQKAARLVQIGKIIQEEYGGCVPDDVETLTHLPGVGRKTANLVRSFAYHQPAVCVDTHVHRISNRWGLVRTATPEQTETALRQVLPREYWIETNPFLVQHGQQVCRPLRPACGTCGLRTFCRFDRVRAEQEFLARVPGAPGHPSLTRWDPDERAGTAGEALRGPFSEA